MSTWPDRLRDALYNYLPLVVLLALAGATWWLVRMSPGLPSAQADKAAATTPDYTLSGFELRRYSGTGELLGQVSGKALRHYPVDERMEIDQVRMRSESDTGPLWVTAEQALVTQQGDRIDLSGRVQLKRDAAPQRPAFVVDTATMTVEVPQQRAYSRDPVQLVQEGVIVTAQGFVYTQTPAWLELQGPVKAVYRPLAASSVTGVPSPPPGSKKR